MNLPLASRTPPINCHAASSRSVSSPGSTTAPCGNAATACRNFAVTGIEPVEPAAITGPSCWAVSRAASASISRSRRAAGSILPCSRMIAGHVSRAILRNCSVSCQYWSSASGTSPSSARHSTLRVTMSSISRARSSASASVDSGPAVTSGACRGSSGRICLAHKAINCASSRRRCRPSIAGGVSSAVNPGEAAWAKASSSSSISPSATMRGSTAASVFNSSRKISRAMRPARRVGR